MIKVIFNTPENIRNFHTLIIAAKNKINNRRLELKIQEEKKVNVSDDTTFELLVTQSLRGIPEYNEIMEKFQVLHQMDLILKCKPNIIEVEPYVIGKVVEFIPEDYFNY